MSESIILQKFIAQSGRNSRRQAEALIRGGLVTVNGCPAELGMKVTDADDVRVSGEAIGLREEMIYIILNKPVDFVCTTRHFPGEKNIFDLLKSDENNLTPGGMKGQVGPSAKGLVIAGRLDKDSRGLLLLTNDGELVNNLTHPRYEHEKEYLVKVRSQKSKVKIPATVTPISPRVIPAKAGIQKEQNVVKKLVAGIDIEGGDGIVRVKSAREIDETTYRVILTEGKKRQLRRMFQKLSLHVTDLVRVRIASLELSNLPDGQWRPLTAKEITRLKSFK